MSIVSKVKDILSDVELGEPIFEIQLRHRSAEPVERDRWTLPRNNMGSLMELFVHKWSRRSWNSDDRKFEVNESDVVDRINGHIANWITDIYRECSPYAAPARTNTYRDFKLMLQSNYNNQKFLDSAFDICEYYNNSQKTDSIKSKKNEVHRMNIYHLLNLMEKSYGKKNSN